MSNVILELSNGIFASFFLFQQYLYKAFMSFFASSRINGLMFFTFFLIESVRISIQTE